MGGDALLLVRLADEHDAVGQRERRRAVDERRRHDMRASVEHAGMLREGAGRLGFRHANDRRGQAAQARNPLRISSSSRSRPMNTTFDSRFSPGLHSRCESPSSIMCTPWNTKRLGSPFIATMPLQRRMFGPCSWVRRLIHGMNLAGSTSPSSLIATDCMSSS